MKCGTILIKKNLRKIKEAEKQKKKIYKRLFY